MKTIIFVSKFKVPISRETIQIKNKDGNMEDEVIITELSVGRKDMEFISKEEKEVESLMLKLQEISADLKGYNNMQIKIAEQDSTRDYIYKKIITKD